MKRLFHLHVPPQRVNSAELLRLYLDYDLLDEAASLVLEMLDSVCGKGKEYFGLKTFLHTGAPAVWLPYTAIDQLLLALRDVRTEPHYTEVSLRGNLTNANLISCFLF